MLSDIFHIIHRFKLQTANNIIHLLGEYNNECKQLNRVNNTVVYCTYIPALRYSINRHKPLQIEMRNNEEYVNGKFVNNHTTIIITLSQHVCLKFIAKL